jgi:hypothetical protein
MHMHQDISQTEPCRYCWLRAGRAARGFLVHTIETRKEQGGIVLFGPDRTLIGDESVEWSVWITGMDDVLPQPDKETALSVAAEFNATSVQVYDGSEFSPVTHAVVVHNGYAWKRGD